MTDQYIPSPDDVESAAKARSNKDGADSWAVMHPSWRALEIAYMDVAVRVLHARGWRDAGEVAEIEKRAADLADVARSEQDNHTETLIRAQLAEEKLSRYVKEFGDVDGLRAYVGKFQSQRDLALADRDVARAEVEAVRKERDSYAADYDKWHSAYYAIEADRDALAAKLAEAEKKLAGVGVEEFYAVSYRLSEVCRDRDALAAERDRDLSETRRFQADHIRMSQRLSSAEARAAKLAEALTLALSAMESEKYRRAPMTEADHERYGQAMDAARAILAADTAEKETK